MSACPSGDQLRLLLEQRLSPPDRAALETHVDGCAGCQGRLEELTRDTVLSGRLHEGRPGPQPWAPEDFLRRLRQATPLGTGVSPGPAEPEPGPAQGPAVAGFEVLGVLGRGGMGVVYRARQAGLGRLVALKILLAGPHADGRDRARFRAEAEAVARLRHPHIVQIHAVGEQDGRPYFALEYVEGGTLADQLDGTPLPARRAAELLEALARATHYAHTQGIVHRDLKPANVLLTADGTPKVADFGLAKQMGEAAGLTGSDSVLGTPSYMAPEQAGGKRAAVGPPADVYALGAILYEALTGRPPFKAETALDTLQQVVWQDPVPPSRLQPKVPRDLETVCLQCLHKDSRRRYPTAGALADDLERFLGGRPVRARRTGPVERGWRWCRRNPALATASALAGAALVAAVAVLLFHLDNTSRTIVELDNARVTAQTERDEADTQRRLADQRRIEAEYQRAIMAFDHGTVLCKQGDVDQGMFWLAHTLEIATQIKAGDLERAARLNLASWRDQLHPLEACLDHPQPVLGCRFSQDDRFALTLCGDHTVHRWEAATGRPLGQPLGHPGASVADWKARLWDVKTGKLLGSPLEHPSGPLLDVAFSPDAGLALTAAFGNTAQLWDLRRSGPTAEPAGARVGPPLRHAHSVPSVAFAPDGRSVLTGSADRTARLWRVSPAWPPEPTCNQPHQSHVLALAVRRDGRTVVSGSQDGTVRVWDAATGTVLATPVHRQPDLFNPMALSADGHTILIGSGDGTAQLWRVGEAQPLTLRHPEGGLLYVALSPDGRTALTCSQEQGTARSWEVSTGQLLGPPLRHPGRVWSVALSPDGKTALTGGEDGTARLWDAVTGTPREGARPPRHDGWVVRAAFSPDGKTVLTGSFDRTARLWDAATGKPLGRPMEHESPPGALAFSPDGRLFLTGEGRLFLTADDRLGARAQLWDAKTGWPVGPASRPSRPTGFRSAAFSPDGHSFWMGCSDGSVWRWAVPAPLEGDPERIKLWLQVVTGTESDEGGAIRILGAHDWDQRRQWLHERGGPPGP
jgi:WD40 repeat protein